MANIDNVKQPPPPPRNLEDVEKRGNTVIVTSTVTGSQTFYNCAGTWILGTSSYVSSFSSSGAAGLAMPSISSGAGESTSHLQYALWTLTHFQDQPLQEQEERENCQSHSQLSAHFSRQQAVPTQEEKSQELNPLHLTFLVLSPLAQNASANLDINNLPHPQRTALLCHLLLGHTAAQLKVAWR